MNFERLAIHLRALLSAAGLGLTTPFILAEASPPPPASPAYTPEQKAALAALDGAIERFEALLERDDDNQHKSVTAVVLAGIKQRRTALREIFDQARYDELRVDLNLEYQRLAQWMAPPKNPPTAGAKDHP